MNFISTELEEYVIKHTDGENDLLKQINRETHANVLKPRMLSGHFQGRVLSMICAMIKPKAILEIGTFTGYSALCMAENLSNNGKLITIDINEELEDTVRKYFAQSGHEDKIEYKIGNALEIIPNLTQTFDLVFIDADKINYLNYYHLVLPKLNKDGFIIADNVLWSGKVVEKSNKTDKDLDAILQFNEFIQNDTRVKNVLFPIRDGLMVVQKIE